ncbi:MAG TPA: transglycosylase SLT domain-containing protein [Paraburkholderia sp.]
MTAKSIVQVEIQDGPFREFYELFGKYQKQLEEMPDDWKKVVDAIDDAGGEMEDFSHSSKSSKEFLMIAAIQADAISKAMAKATGVQDKFNTRAKDGANQMGRMAKFSKELHKDVSKMSGILLKLGALGGTALALPAAAYASVSAMAGQNLQARGLGLRIGQTQAFEANFEKFGLGASDLGNVANAQGNPAALRAFISAGLTPQQVQSEDAEQLTYDFARGASAKYRQWMQQGGPMYATTMAQGSGFTDILSLQQLRAGSSYGDKDWQQAQQREMTAAQKAAVDQGTADQASDVKASLKSDWAEVINTFNDQLAKSGPELKAMGDAAAAAAINLLKVAGPEAKAVVDALQGPPVSRADAAKQGGVAGGFARFGYGLRDLFSGNGGTQTAPTLFSMIDSQYSVESGRGKHNLSPKGAMGPMQFMPDAWKDWGHGDVNNLADSQDAARRYDAFLLKRYGGDVKKALAAYNWGIGNLDKDIAKNGSNWESHAPRETQDYLVKIQQLLLRQGQNVNINITNSTAANVATSMNAAPH